MSYQPQPRIDDDLNTYALTIASAAAGGALGVLFGRGMERRTSNITALVLLAAGAVIAGPTVSGLIARAANRPSTQRGSKRRLESIRNGAVPEGDEMFMVDHPL
jgi:hypothetical protein